MIRTDPKKTAEEGRENEDGGRPEKEPTVSESSGGSGGVPDGGLADKDLRLQSRMRFGRKFAAPAIAQLNKAPGTQIVHRQDHPCRSAATGPSGSAEATRIFSTGWTSCAAGRLGPKPTEAQHQMSMAPIHEACEP